MPEPPPEIKRRYLQILLSQGQQAADVFLKANRPDRGIFRSHEDHAAYQKEIGRSVIGYIVPPPSDPSKIELYESLYALPFP